MKEFLESVLGSAGSAIRAALDFAGSNRESVLAVILLGALVLAAAHLILQVRVSRYSLIQDLSALAGAVAAVLSLIILAGLDPAPFGGEFLHALAVAAAFVVSGGIPPLLGELAVRHLQKRDRDRRDARALPGEPEK